MELHNQATTAGRVAVIDAEIHSAFPGAPVDGALVAGHHRVCVPVSWVGPFKRFRLRLGSEVFRAHRLHTVSDDEAGDVFEKNFKRCYERHVGPPVRAVRSVSIVAFLHKIAIFAVMANDSASPSMTTNSDRPLKTLILDLMLEVKELRMQLRQMEENADRRHEMVVDWCAPQCVKDAIEAVGDADFEEIETPTDVTDELSTWLDKSR
ncbi:hypothetical protein VQ042_23920 [Aurantimonas sp. A2-1-M11]|uniref:hypothetical protein n=1 Tax=Aurantimonas sp. A2-1-M11 TaxID=3113712 RepID=UPI002F95AE0F